MKYIIRPTAILFCFFIFIGCKKTDNGGNTTPTNLVIITDISSDGSGTVAFTATADNAVSYDYEFGNGEVRTVVSGIVTYIYTLEGSHTYPVTVTAKSSSGLKIKKTVDITVTVNTSIPGLFWSDEFNANGAPDPLKWGYDIGGGVRQERAPGLHGERVAEVDRGIFGAQFCGRDRFKGDLCSTD